MTERTIAPMTSAQLEAEERGARRTGVLAMLSGFLMLGGLFVTASVSPNDALDRREGLLHNEQHATSLLVANALFALSFILLAVVLTFLFKAIMSRSAEAPGVGRSAAITGPVLVGLLGMATQIAVIAIARDFVDDPVRTLDAATEKLDTGLINALEIASFASKLLLGVGLLLAALHAMRTGLLTKGQGVTGIALAIMLAVIGPFPLPQALWLGWIGTTLLATGDRKLPAWREGRAVPWPNARELRAQAEAQDAAVEAAALEHDVIDVNAKDVRPAEPNATDPAAPSDAPDSKS